MATPTLTRHHLPGRLGPIDIDVRAGGRDQARPAVVVVHGFKGFKDWGMFPALAERLARAGFSAVSLNVSGSGVDAAGDFSQVERFGHNTWSAELSDVGAVLDALAAGDLGTAPPSSIGVLGHSRGGGMAVLLAARDDRIRALVTWAAISTVHRWPEETIRRWRAAGRHDVINARTGQVLPLYTDILDDIELRADALDIASAAARVTVPWLIVHGEADEAVSIREGEVLRDAARPSTTRFERIEGNGAGHTFGARHPWAGTSGELERAMAGSVAWFARNLG
jgi:dienelactone hydrolase